MTYSSQQLASGPTPRTVPRSTNAQLDLRTWLTTIKNHDQLHEIDQPIDPIEEMGAITYLLARTPSNSRVVRPMDELRISAYVAV